MASKGFYYQVVAEYVWIDADNNLRSKTKIFTVPISNKLKNFTDIDININDFPDWNFDGSSTGQSETRDSDIIIKPVYFVKNSLIDKSDRLENCRYYIVLCKLANHNDNNYDETKQLFHLTLFEDPWFGIEQEYIMLNKNGELLEYDNYTYTGIDNPDSVNTSENRFYCSVGCNNTFGRKIAMEHMHKCIEADIKICGINSEVTPSQWEFQIGPLNAIEVCEQLWIARYMLIQIAEKYNVVITFHPKPFTHLNGSGAHTNFSTKSMREQNGIEKIYEAINKMSKKHTEHIKVYGRYNELRLTGKNETANINEFKYGSCDRGSSIRIPVNVVKDKRGYLEDRRPASNIDPYLVVSRILKTVFEIE